MLGYFLVFCFSSRLILKCPAPKAEIVLFHHTHTYMAEFPKPDSDSVAGLDHMNRKSDVFIVDLESFSNGEIDKHVAANSTINVVTYQKTQRCLSRKGCLQGEDQESSSSPRGVEAGLNSTPGKLGKAYSETPVVVVVSNNQPNQQPSKYRWGRRYESLKRSPPPYWYSDPKRIVLFFATLSSVGTLLLIYLTLCMSKSDGNE